MNPIAGYDACKSVVINHTGDGAQTNYQMKLTIIKGDGADSTGVLYADNKCTNWPNDVRFTKVDGVSLLDFWREEYDATDGTWWIEVDSIPAHPDDATIYVHVGDADAADASSGAATFLFFDNFDGDLAQWEGDTAAAAIASSIMTLTSTASAWKYIRGTTNISGNVRCRIRSYRLDPVDPVVNSIGLAGDAAGDSADAVYSMGHFLINHPHGRWACLNTNVQTVFTDAVGDWNAYYTDDFMRVITGTDTARAYHNGTQTGSDSTTNVPTVDLCAKVGSYGSSKYIKIDWVWLGNYTLNEPTFGAWGNWEAASVAAMICMNMISSMAMMS